MKTETKPGILTVETLASTNATMKERYGEFGHADALMCRRQTAGRGQRGNSWESEPGMNVTMSVMLRHSASVPADKQFSVSEAVAVAIVDVLRTFLPADADICVKWPNDIYAGDNKICGILIENSISGAMLDRSVSGIGLNVNQTEFLSNAPNPISMAQIASRIFDVDEVAETVRARIEKLYSDFVTTSSGRSALHDRYRAMLWRRNGLHSYTDTATGQEFLAAIEDIELSGHLILRDSDNRLRRYAFKEVAAVL